MCGYLGCTFLWTWRGAANLNAMSWFYFTASCSLPCSAHCKTGRYSTLSLLILPWKLAPLLPDIILFLSLWCLSGTVKQKLFEGIFTLALRRAQRLFWSCNEMMIQKDRSLLLWNGELVFKPLVSKRVANRAEPIAVHPEHSVRWCLSRWVTEDKSSLRLSEAAPTWSLYTRT